MSNQQIDKKQKLLLECLISDKESFVKCIRITKSNYFESPLDRVVDCILEFYGKYHKAPTVEVIEAETGIVLQYIDMDDADRQFFLDEYEKLCRHAAMRDAILESVELLNEDNNEAIPDMVRQALMVKLDNTVGTSLFKDPLHRIENMSQSVDERGVGIQQLDQLISKVRRGELGFFFAETAGGKSVTLANVARLMAKQKLNVFIISLELNEELYSKRLDAIVGGFDIASHAKNAVDIADELARLEGEMGDIVTKKVKYGTTHEMIRTYVMEYHMEYGKYPDVLIVDYLGLMGSAKKTHSNKSEEDEVKAFGIRDICVDYMMYGFSAGQINRDGYDVQALGPQHIAGGISVINASDWAVGLVATEEDIENNQVQAVQMKVRNGGKSKKPVILYRCPHTLRISDMPFSGQSKKTASAGSQSNGDQKSGQSSGSDKLKSLIRKGKSK